ncbi:MAG: ATP-binding protein [Polyangia bacterium]
MRTDALTLPAADIADLLQAIEALSLARSADEVIGLVRSAARRLTGADGATFVLREGDNVFYADEDAITPLWKGQRFPAARCISGWAIVNRTTVAVPDIYADARVPVDAYRPTFVKSLVVVPIRTRDPLGAIGAYWARQHEADARERFLLEALANASAGALANAELYHSLVLAKTAEQQARAAAEAASRAKDEFLAMLGHELRNPLSPILTAIELMKMRGATGFERECGIIERQAQHLIRLVEDLLDISRITRGKLTLRMEPVELGAVVAKAIETASPLLDKRRHRLHVAVPREGLLVVADASRLAQVLSNILNNAAKYTEPGGDISITAAREGETAAVRVRDSGSGIAPELLPHIFDLFVQGSQALDRSQGGLGVGLTIARSLVAMHGGGLSATSEGVGRGSEFTVRLPLAPTQRRAPAAAPAAPVQESEPAPATRSLRILMVDDNEDAISTLAEYARAQGHMVRLAHDGLAALRAVQGFVPDLALLDIGLPVLDGYELVQRLRQQPALAHVRMIAVTGYGQESDRRRALAAGFDEHIVKPLTIERFQALLSEQSAAVR